MGANRGRVNYFYAGKKVGEHINLCTHIRELRYTKGGKAGRVIKKCASRRGGSGEFERGLPPFTPPPQIMTGPLLPIFFQV